MSKKEKKRGRTHGHRQRCGDFRMEMEVEEGINDDGKNKINILKYIFKVPRKY